MITVRVATTDDVADLGPVVQLGAAELNSLGLPTSAPGLLAGVEIAITYGVVVVAEQHAPRALVGFSAWAPDILKPESRELLDACTWVTPTMRRRGLCTEMQALAAEHAKLRGYESVYTIVPRSDAAGRAAKRAGYYVVSLRVRRVL